MALTKAMDFGNGVTTKAAYIEVSSISIDFDNKSVNFMVKTYLNKEAKDKGLLTIINPEHFSINNAMMPPRPGADVQPEPTKTFTEFFEVGDARENAEKYLRTLPNYSTCVPVVVVTI